MFFTENDYKKIRDWLLKNGRGIKDSQFQLTDNMKLADELVFLQDAVNKRIPLCAVLDFITTNIPIISKKFIDDLIGGTVGIPDEEWSQNPDYPDYPDYPLPEDKPSGCDCSPITDEMLEEIFSNEYNPSDPGESSCGCNPITDSELKYMLK